MTTETRRDKWLARRQGSLGASDAAAALGCNPWKSSLALYLEKRGEIDPENLDNDPCVHWGNVLEPAVRAEVKRRVGAPVENPGRYAVKRHAEYPWMTCTLDGQLDQPTPQVVDLFDSAGLLTEVNGSGVVEIKTAGYFMRNDWGGGCCTRPEWEGAEWPLQYQVQTQHQLAVTGYRWGLLAVLIAGYDFRIYPFAANYCFQTLMIESEQLFWQRVQDGIPPDADGSAATTDALRRRWPQDDGETIVLPVDAMEWDEELLELKDELRGLENRKRGLENQLRAALGPATYGMLSDGTQYSLKQQTRKEHMVKESTFRALRRKAAQ